MALNRTRGLATGIAEARQVIAEHPDVYLVGPALEAEHAQAVEEVQRASRQDLRLQTPRGQ